MPVEIEAKIKVPDLEPTRRKLRELNAASDRLRLEINTFFDTEDGSLKAADKGLRVRINRFPQSGKEEAIITFKGPRQAGPFKSREETELNIDDAKTAAKLFTALGFPPVLSFEKRRESWKLDGCHVELDELPYLGTFVEIEGPSDEVVKKTQEKIGLKGLKPVKESYIGMLMEYLKENGITDRVIGFEQR